MSRGLTDEPNEPEQEQPENIDLLQMIYALGLYIEDVDKKIVAIAKKLDVEVDEPRS